MKALQKFRLPAYSLSALHHWSFAIRHLFLMLNHVHETPDINIGPENA
jgi:hypothetical protein